MLERPDPVRRCCRRAFVPILLSTALAFSACGGGGGGEGAEPPVPPTALTVTNDAAQSDWNQSVVIDVLANDRASAGTLTLSAVGTPGHGSARIESGRLVYTPEAGYFGTDAVGYTARAEPGGATANGTVAITVTAAMSLSGRVADVALPGAAIRLDVGSRSQTTTADDQGSFTLQLRTAQPEDALRLQATGAGENAHIQLVSLLGDAQALAALADATGAIGAATTPLLRVSPVTTALAAWVAQAANGGAASTRAQIDALILRTSPEGVRNAAAAVKLVASYGVPLPAGVADTYALLESPASSSVYAGFLATQQSLANGDVFERWQEARAAAIVDATALTASPVAGPSRTWVYFVGYRQEGYGPLTVTYRADGSATVVGRDNSQAATWRIDDGVLKLTYQEPIVSEEMALDSSGRMWRMRITERGHEIRSFSAHMQLHRSIDEYTWLTGPDAGRPVPISDGGGVVKKAVALDTTPGLTATELPVGTLWAGLQDGPLAAGEADLFEVTGSAAARLRRGGRALGWAVVDGWLQITTAGGLDRRYRRLWSDADGGDEYWLACDFRAGTAQACHEQFIVKPVTDAAFVNDSHLHRRWRTSIGSDTPNATVYTVYADGTGLDPLAAQWTLDAQGIFTLRYNDTTRMVRERSWMLLRRNGPDIYVLEHLRVDYVDPAMTDVDQWRVNVYTDLGAASR